MSVCVEPNRIPAEPIVQVIRGYLDAMGERLTDGTFQPLSLHLLAERADILGDTLYHLLSGRTQTIDFDLADRLLCVTNQTELWLTDLQDIYEEAVLEEGEKKFNVSTTATVARCANKGCSNTFSLVRTHGGRPRKYCSEKCRRRMADVRKRERQGRPVRFSNHNDTCVHGHDWTPENTLWFHEKKDGKKRKRCKTCVYARNEAARRQKREAT